MKRLISDILYSISNIRPCRGVYKKQVYPFVVTFTSVRWLVDTVMDIYFKYYNFDAVIAWRDSDWRRKPRNVWNTFFDVSTGSYIDSYASLKKLERTGKIFATPRELEAETVKNSKANKLAYKKKIRKELLQDYRAVKQGKSFVKELNAKYLQR